MRKILIASGIITTVGLLTLKTYKIPIDNQYLGRAFKYLDQKDQNWGLIFFRLLIKNHYLSGCDRINEIVLSNGIDIEGRLLQGLYQMGFKGVQIGPISYSPMLPQQNQYQHLGINYVRSKIQSLIKQNKQKQFKIGINLTADYQIIKYTPYIMKDNILNAISQIMIDNHSVDYVVLNFNHPFIHKILNNFANEYQNIINDVVDSVKNYMKTYSQQNKVSLPKLVLQIDQQSISKYLNNINIDKFVGKPINQNPQKFIQIGKDKYTWKNLMKLLWEIPQTQIIQEKIQKIIQN